MIWLMVALLCLLAIVVLFQRKTVDSKWPWWSMLAFSVSLSRMTPLWGPDRLIGFSALMAMLILGWRGDAVRWAAAAIVGLSQLSPQTNPNIIASVILCCPFGPWTVAGAIWIQSLGAMVGVAVSKLIEIASVRLSLVAMVVMAVVICLHGSAERPAIATEALRLFLARPALGWGSGSYYQSLVRGGAESEAMRAVTLRTGFGHAHSSLLTIAAENGLFGLIPLAVMLISIGRSVASSKEPSAKLSVIAFAVQQLVDDSWLYVPVSILLGLSLNSLEASDE